MLIGNISWFRLICVIFILPVLRGLSFSSYILISNHTSLRLMIIARECDRNGIIASGAADDAIRLFVENQEKGVLDTCLTLLLAFARIRTIILLDMSIFSHIALWRSLFLIFWKPFIMVQYKLVRLLDCRLNMFYYSFL